MLDEIQMLLDNLKVVEEKGFKLKHKYIGAVRIGDYLFYEKIVFEETKKDALHQVQTKCCGRVSATGGEQGSGPVPDKRWLAIEGDPTILQYVGQDYVLVLEAPQVSPDTLGP